MASSRNKVPGNMSAQERMVDNEYWWPNRVSLEPLRRSNPASSPLGAEFAYAPAFESLDLEAVKADLVKLMTTS